VENKKEKRKKKRRTCTCWAESSHTRKKRKGKRTRGVVLRPTGGRGEGGVSGRRPHAKGVQEEALAKKWGRGKKKIGGISLSKTGKEDMYTRWVNEEKKKEFEHEEEEGGEKDSLTRKGGGDVFLQRGTLRKRGPYRRGGSQPQASRIQKRNNSGGKGARRGTVGGRGGNLVSGVSGALAEKGEGWGFERGKIKRVEDLSLGREECRTRGPLLSRFFQEKRWKKQIPQR